MEEENYSIGERFYPTALELLYYLRSKIEKGNIEFISDKDVYEDDPWRLKHVTPHPIFKENEWFYFVQKTKGKGGYSLNRTIPVRSECGMWKSIDPLNRKTKIRDDNMRVIGYKQSYVYCKKVKGNPKGKETDWWMKVYSLCDDDRFQDWVLCKIRYKPSQANDMKDEEKEEGGLLGLVADEFEKMVLEKEEGGLLGLVADEFEKMVLEKDGDVQQQQQQQTLIPLPQAQYSGLVDEFAKMVLEKDV